MSDNVKITLSFTELSHEDNAIDFYDASRAMIGFQRSLALTCHFVLNDEIITKAPFIKNFEILCLPSQQGSWKTVAVISGFALTGISYLGTAPQNSVIGHLMVSAYDYVISESMGFHVDFNKTLGQQYDELKKKGIDIKKPDPTRFDSLMEKTQESIKDMHRPISHSGTAQKANISAFENGKNKNISQELNLNTFNYISENKVSTKIDIFIGKISSYNINTFSGRIFIESESRTIPFELDISSRTLSNILIITNSLTQNSIDRFNDSSQIVMHGYKVSSPTGKLKKIIAIRIEKYIYDAQY